jgi:hypothetical protein
MWKKKSETHKAAAETTIQPQENVETTMAGKVLGWADRETRHAAGFALRAAWHEAWTNRGKQGKMISAALAFVAVAYEPSSYYIHWKLQNIPRSEAGPATGTSGREGTVTNFTRKWYDPNSLLTGWLCRTYEAQLAMEQFGEGHSFKQPQSAQPITSVWDFSVPDSTIREKILEASISKRPVSISYRQFPDTMSSPWPLYCRRQTEYEATGVTFLDEVNANPGQGAPEDSARKEQRREGTPLPR